MPKKDSDDIWAYVPLGDKIKVQPDEKTAAVIQTKSGLFLPQNTTDAKERRITGTVVAVGKACSEIKAGDRVMFGDYSGTIIYEDSKTGEPALPETGDEFRWMVEDNIIGVKRRKQHG